MTTGLGILSLNGPAPLSWLTFQETIPTGRTVKYLLESSDGQAVAVIEGTLTHGTPPTLTRDRIIVSKVYPGAAGTANISLPTGTHIVTCVWTAEDADFANPILFTPSITAGALVIDLDRNTDSYHRITLNQNIIAGGISFINYPPGICKVYLEFNQVTPSGTVYDIPISAWTGGPGTITFDTDYFVYQDITPTIVSIVSTDGMTTGRARNNSELQNYLAATDINTLAKLNTLIVDTDVVATTDSRLTNARVPTAHATSHKTAGSDAIKLDELAAPTDITTLNSSLTTHGLLPKLGGGTTNYLRADGTWSTPPGGGGGGTDSGLVMTAATTVTAAMTAKFIAYDAVSIVNLTTDGFSLLYGDDGTTLLTGV